VFAFVSIASVCIHLTPSQRYIGLCGAGSCPQDCQGQPFRCGFFFLLESARIALRNASSNCTPQVTLSPATGTSLSPSGGNLITQVPPCCAPPQYAFCDCCATSPSPAHLLAGHASVEHDSRPKASRHALENFVYSCCRSRYQNSRRNKLSSGRLSVLRGGRFRLKNVARHLHECLIQIYHRIILRLAALGHRFRVTSVKRK